MKILIASPVQQKPEILRMFLYTVQHVRKPDDCEVHYHFVDDNEREESSAILRQFQASQPNVKISRYGQHMRYVVDESTHYWTEDNMERVGRMKDEIIREAIREGFDYVWFIDSDLLVHPDSLIHLLQADKDIISCIFWTKWREDDVPMPQVWQSDQYSMVRARSPARSDKARQAAEAEAFLEKLKKPGIHEVGGLGACTLVSRSALTRGVRFEYIPNLSMPGEDRHFCIRAAVLGFRLYVDTRTPAYHLYRSADLEGGYRFIETHYQADLRRTRVSLCIVVKDDEDNLDRCLRSAEGIADEIIVVDAGGGGRTAEVAAAHGARVFRFDWNDDWSAARNDAFAQATMDYILWLDADDVIEREDRFKLLELLKQIPPDVDSVLMDHHLVWQENGRPLLSRKRHRLVRRACGFRWEGAGHERLQVTGKTLRSDIGISRRASKDADDRRLELYARLLEKGADLGPRDLLGYAIGLADHGRHDEAIPWFEKFLAADQGSPDERAEAHMRLAACYGAAGDRKKQQRMLLDLFSLMMPPPEALCQLGTSFLEEGKHRQAVFWFEAAVRYREEEPDAGGWIDHPSRTWLPHLQLSVCYDRLGDIDKAHACNEEAAKYRPDHPSVLYNRAYFHKVLGEKAGTRGPA
ncbi:MAG: glycosyltransferase [Thermobacillus sp.]|uniref:glycosyltransferase n=1 Tax=Thermobacillus sp. TaxID=2108467 RepID=UPI000E389EB2|nr:glycosyltransferase [Thermobacillus sp.]REK56577.1 MAG: glycosyltransferase [Thermobacillus sp.]